VKLYVKWLYTGTIDIRTTGGPLNEDRIKEAETLFAVLVKAYIFGAKVLDTIFNKVVLGKLIQVQPEYSRTPGPDVFCTLYSETSAGCLARRLMTQFVAHNAHFDGDSEWATYFEGYPRELLIDIFKAMVHLRSPVLRSPWKELGVDYLTRSDKNFDCNLPAKHTIARHSRIPRLGPMALNRHKSTQLHAS
jgi:hypothetical protein